MVSVTYNAYKQLQSAWAPYGSCVTIELKCVTGFIPDITHTRLQVFLSP